VADPRTTWLDRTLAALALSTGLAHLLLELAYHLRFGQFLRLLWGQLFAAGLLIAAAAAAFDRRPARPWLCGAFGFAFALHWTTFFQAAEVGLEGAHAPALVAVLRVSGAALVLTGIGFVAALVATRPRGRA
jgi:hypothetical protein